MKFFTSYYANYKNIPKNYLCVSISRTIPDGFLGKENFIFVPNSFLSPSKDLLEKYKNGNISDKDYEEFYLRDLEEKFIMDKNEFPSMVDWIDSISYSFEDNFDAIVFLCYESPEKFCHRHILSKYIREKCHVQIEEFPYKESNKKENKENKTTELF